MTVTFRPIRYGHILEAKRLSREIEAGTIESEIADKYVFDLVASWDYKDIESGELIPVDQPHMLSAEQYNQLMAEFNEQMSGAGVKKTSNAPASSGRNGSKTVRQATP